MHNSSIMNKYDASQFRECKLPAGPLPHFNLILKPVVEPEVKINVVQLQRACPFIIRSCLRLNAFFM